MHLRLCSFVLIAGVCITAIFVPLSSGAAGTSLPSCSTAQLVPNISELAVDQGLPTYTRLARGKEALVRAYLTVPSSCALTRTQKIEPTFATLTVANGSTQGQLANEGTLSGALGSAAQISSTADPYFVVRASDLTPANNGAAFNATFTLQVTYKRTDGTSVTSGLVTSPAATNATKTVQVDRRTNALRILVVPIGDPTAGTVQFSADANTAIQNMMTAASRAFPVPAGTGDLSPTGPTATGGIRYALNGGLLDARSLGLLATSGGLTKFCSNATNFATSLIGSGPFAGLTLKGQLQQALSDYNVANPTKPADMVLGAADETSSWASSSGVQCPAPATASPGGPDDGRASGPTAFAIGKPAWARITYNGVSSPGFMEMAHNLGICRVSPCVGLHSPNVEADGTAPNRGMNVTQRKVLYAGGALGNDHSAMNYNPTIPYSINNILLEPNDWKDILCDLGGVDSQTVTPFSACPLGSAPGTAVNVGANVGLDVNGTTDGTDARVTNSYSRPLDTGLQTLEDPGSTTRLLLKTGSCDAPGSGSTLLNYGLPVQSDDGHTLNQFNGDPPEAPNAFHALVPFNSTTTMVQVLVNNSLKYCRSATAPPEVTDTTVQPLGAAGQLLRSFATPTAGSGGRGMAFDGNTLWTSFASGTNIYQVSTTGSLLRTVGVGHTIGALAYDPGNGHLYGGNYNPEMSGDDGKIYDITTGADPTTSDKFTFVPTGTACRGGNLGAIDGLELLPSGGFAISGDAANTLFLTNANGTPSSSFPVSCNSGITTDGASGLWRVDLSDACCGNPSTIVHSDLAGAQLGSFPVGPNYEPEDIAYDSVTFAPQCALWMNEAGSAQIRAYSVPCGGATPPATTKAVTFTATGDDLVGTAYVTCGGESPKYPVADSLSPVDTEAAVKSFSFAFTSTLSCGNGTPTVITTVSNGLYQSSLTDANATKTFDSTDKPPAPAIAAPVNNANFGAGSKIAYNGSAFDAEEGALSGASLKWYMDDNRDPIGTGSAFDLPAPSAGNHIVKLVATDSAGFAEKTVTIHVDSDPPLLALSPGTNAGSTASENVTASDADSGLANVFCSVDNLPATLNPALTDPGATYTAAFTYSSGIIHQLSCTALDRAGNQTTVNAISQFAPAAVSCVGAPGRTVLQPVNPDGSSVFKKGSTVPVKFRVCDAGGNSIGPSQVVDFRRATPPSDGTSCDQPSASPTSFRVPVFCRRRPGVSGVDEAVSSTNADTSFRWSSADRSWVFNLSTNNLVSGFKYTYYIPLIDDTNIFFTFGVK
jgi:hypothetical protein